MDPIDRRLMLGAAGLAGVAALSKFGGVARAGPLDPPEGPISPTGKTTTEVFDRVEAAEALLRDRIARTDAGVAEPRIPVQSLPGSKTALHVISEPGSYYLTGNLVGAAGMHGIEVSAPDVTIDLCGYGLRGVGGSLSAVTDAGGSDRLWVGNGSISDWSWDGVFARFARAVTVARIGFSGVGGRAAWVSVQGRILQCSATSCGGRAFSVESLGAIEDCTADQCGAPAVFGQNRVAVHRCLLLRSGEGVVIEGDGVVTECDITECGAGIIVFSGAVVRGNRIRQCGTGIGIGSGSHVRDNVVETSATGIDVSGTGSLCAGNTVRATSTSFVIAPGNAYGPIVTVAGSGDISTVPNANHPWANFVY